MSISFSQELPVERREDRLFCLEDRVHNVGFNIVEPADSLDPDKLTPVQERAFFISNKFISIEEYLDVTLEEFTQLAVQQENPCFTIPDDPY